MRRAITLCAVLLTLQGNIDGKERKPAYKPLTTRDIIEIVKEYDIVKSTVPIIGNPIVGLVFIKGTTTYNPKKIWINDLLNDKHYRLVLLHEMRHAYNSANNISQREDWVREFSCKDYQTIFEESCPKDDNLEDQIKEGR